MRHDFSSAPVASGRIEVRLDGLPVDLPLEHRSLNAIRCRLEAKALASQRVLCSIKVDGRPANLALPLVTPVGFFLVEAETVALRESSILVFKRALQQTDHVRECVETALTLVLINDAPVARELWWNLAGQLKEPVLTLSLLPDDACGPARGGASLIQLRQWQLEQVAAIIRDADDACRSESTIPLSNALETRVLPWLENLSELINLWHDTVMAKASIAMNGAS
jgi:hypothetical protein